MRIFFVLLLIQLFSSPVVSSFADEKSDCLNNCSQDKRSTEMYCPPAGGFSNDDHAQCIDKAGAAFADCVKNCSPAAALPEPEQAPPPSEAVPPQPAAAAEGQENN